MEQLSRIPKLPGIGAFRNLAPSAKRELRLGMTFVGLWIIGFLGFTLLPTVATFVFSLTNLKLTDGIFSSPEFVGLRNYEYLFNDTLVWNLGLRGGQPGAIWVTIRFGLIALPVGIILPLLIAMLLNNRNVRGQGILRSLFYMPFIVPFVAAVLVWGGMLNPETGWINRMLIDVFGMAPGDTPGWAFSTEWVYPAYVIMGIWGIGNAILIMSAGLQSVPTELYDAAAMDGANAFQSFWNVTFPMISPVIFYNLVLSMVGLFQYFLVPLVVNQGNGRPGGFTYFYNLYLYRNFFTYQDMAYGATLAWVLFVIILIFTLILFWSARFWVYYAGDARS
jgi:multiple sugar transport system permease protein